MLSKIYEILSTLDEQQQLIVLEFLKGLTGGAENGNQRE